MVQYQRSKEELHQALGEQISFLRSSCFLFDQGHFAEAQRLAATARTLLHESEMSEPLLGQLGYLERPFLSTASPLNPDNFAPHVGLCFIYLDTQLTYVPLLGAGDRNRTHREMPFEEWWNEPVIKDSVGHSFTRKSLVLNLANKDGGSHVASRWPGPFANFKKHNALGWKQENGDVFTAVGAAMADYSSMRQIAHELLSMFEPGYEIDHTKPRWHRTGSVSILAFEATPADEETRRKRPGGNSSCPCGSGKKAKRCCYQNM